MRKIACQRSEGGFEVDAFQRFDTKSSIPDGFGLGLFSTKSLANSLGLAVALNSRDGRGTEFSIALSASGAP